jgi:hypothetical protein
MLYCGNELWIKFLIILESENYPTSSYTILLTIGSMGFEFSVEDEKNDTRNIEPWFLNVVRKLSNDNTSTKVSKIDAFIRARLGAYQSNPNEYENYRGRKGNEAYWKMMENVVDSLEGRRFITRHIHPAYILISQEGINVCSREGRWHARYYHTNDETL